MRPANRWYQRYREAKWFEGKKCLFSTYPYTFLKGNLRFILAVVRGSKIYFAVPQLILIKTKSAVKPSWRVSRKVRLIWLTKGKHFRGLSWVILIFTLFLLEQIYERIETQNREKIKNRIDYKSQPQNSSTQWHLRTLSFAMYSLFLYFLKRTYLAQI